MQGSDKFHSVEERPPDSRERIVAHRGGGKQPGENHSHDIVAYSERYTYICLQAKILFWQTFL
jgi:hypothetical protein